MTYLTVLAAFVVGVAVGAYGHKLIRDEDEARIEAKRAPRLLDNPIAGSKDLS